MPPSPSWTVPGKAIFGFHHPLGLWKKNHNPAPLRLPLGIAGGSANRKPQRVRGRMVFPYPIQNRSWDEQTAQPCVIVLHQPST